MKEMYPSLAIFILFLISTTCKGQQANTCNVAPKDQYIEVGSDTEIVCETSCIRGNIYWTLNNIRINESWSNTINSSHTELSLKNFTHHSATLQCHSADTRQVLGGTTIRTYTKPSKISCMWHYDNQEDAVVPQLFTCNWEHQNNSSLKISYSVLVSSSQVNQSEICNSHVTTCTSRDIDTSDKIHFMGNLIVTVRARTAAWEADSDPYEFDPYSILKLIRPQLKVTVLSDHLLVKWNSPIPQRENHCQVKFAKAVSDGTPEKVVNKTLNSMYKVELIEKMESCCTYKVSVRCALVKAPWSDWSQEKTVLTKLNESDIQLQLWRKVAKQKNGVRKVHAMWREIPPTCQDTFTYAIKQIAYKEHTTGVSYTDTLCSSSPCVVDVNQEAHRIILTVFRNETLLAKDSVYVPAVGQSLPQVTEVQTSTMEGVILVSWKPPVQPVRCYMIDWTHSGNQYNWKESKYTNTSLIDLLDKKPYNITVTPLFDNKTGYGTEALQVCSTVGDPGNITIVNVQAYDKSANVRWDTKSQEVCSDAVINYTIFYSAQKGPTLNVTVDGTKHDIFLKDLNPGTQYSVYIIATALTGTTKSSERLFETKRFDPRLLTVLSVSGSIVIVLVLSLGLCCAIQWKKFREKPVPDPGLSSLALWPSADHQKGICQAFTNPSESNYDRVYIEELQRTSNPPLAIGCNPAIEQIEEYTDPATVLAPDIQNEKPAELVQTQHLGSSEESTALISSENGTFNPYRSQGSVETVPAKMSKQYKCLPAKQEKTAPVTVYVTLNMFEQGLGQ
ncbi:interleukin-6 receptor subunit beta-like [Seriola aureovittata]|uniref:interleukin-6 receptor subunit beta-like n=1 Tax=Seriola aureovittata TaxID=2871759 RepID=UPI0024BE9455|nr:interleukin-6 receptor subunit beta-like [Seriola aureovittata]